MSKKNKKIETPKVHEDLEGFNVVVNEFGEIISSKSIDNINEFLNDNMQDKKILDQNNNEDDNENSSEKH